MERKVRRQIRSVFAPLANVLLPAWAVRGLGVVAIAIAVGLPFVAGARGWLRFVAQTDAERSDQSGQLRPRLIALPGGTFWMGSADGVGESNEHPRHEVTVSGFELCETEVSVRQYWLVRGERPSDCVDGCEDDHPVNGVTWFDAVKYMNALTRLENRGRADRGLAVLTECYDEATWAWDRACTGYRLPSEAEWEYAARAGTQTAWSFGDDAKDICKYANVRSEDCDDGFENLAPVRVDGLKPNPWYFHEMHGNVWEWVFDWYDSEFYSSKNVVNPVNTEASEYRALRGGAFNYWPVSTRSAYRGRNRPVTLSRNYGFRCARGAVPQP